jgi:uncharacterized coiled-coil protein SlyX
MKNKTLAFYAGYHGEEAQLGSPQETIEYLAGVINKRDEYMASHQKQLLALEERVAKLEAKAASAVMK